MKNNKKTLIWLATGLALVTATGTTVQLTQPTTVLAAKHHHKLTKKQKLAKKRAAKKLKIKTIDAKKWAAKHSKKTHHYYEIKSAASLTNSMAEQTPLPSSVVVVPSLTSSQNVNVYPGNGFISYVGSNSNYVPTTTSASSTSSSSASSSSASSSSASSSSASSSSASSSSASNTSKASSASSVTDQTNDESAVTSVTNGHVSTMINVNETASDAGGFGQATTGGSNADSVAQVHNYAELKAALSGDAKSRLIMIDGDIDGNNGSTASDYAKDTGYNYDDYVKAYDPATYGMHLAAGTQETARVNAAKNQAQQIVLNVPANTTILGGEKNHLSNINFKVEHDNVIIRNLNMQAPVDDFPQWDGTDSAKGNWNSNYDAISVRGANHVWLDHNTFTDGSNEDTNAKTVYGRQYQQHDGLVDITNGADNLTVSNNFFANHDKTMLIGNSDSSTTDNGKLHVSLISNAFVNTVQRNPRVRFGTVEVLNNYFQNNNQSGAYAFQYGIGAGKDATLLVASNVLNATHDSDKFINKMDDSAKVTNYDNLINDKTDQSEPTDAKPLSDTDMHLIKADAVKAYVTSHAGANNPIHAVL